MSAEHQSNHTDLFGGIALGVATLAALAVANSPFGPQYAALLDTVGEVRVGPAVLTKNLEHWINDGLMALFFLLVGLEIKREMLQGSLAGSQKALLPIVGAVGGFLVPPLIYAAINWKDPQALYGWAIPSTTDIAFVVGICAVLGRAVPASLKAFLLALAIIDDLLAIIVIAVFYTDELSTLSLELALLGVAALVVLNVLNVQKAALFVLVGVYTWVCVLKSGVHATLAGVAVGLAMPYYRIPRPVTVKVRDEYGGCRSWLELTRDLPFEGTPVLSDEEFDRASEEIASIASDRVPVLA